MRRIILIVSAILLTSTGVFGQAKKPTLMVVPSDNWCIQNGYVQEFDNQGKKVKVPDYRKAIQENFEIISVIAKIGELMTERGFPLKDLESALKGVENQSAEDAMVSSKSGNDNGLKESPVDVLKRTARADIWLQVSWSVHTNGPKKTISFILQGLDAYSNKQIASSSGTGAPSFSAELPALLQEAVISHLDNFNSQLQNHFNDMFDNGREVALRIRVWKSFSGDLETEYSGKELGVIIEDWVNENTVQHRFSTSEASENILFFEQVRIPLYEANGTATDTRRWARNLQKFLKDNYKIDSKVTTKGLGEAQIIIGEK